MRTLSVLPQADLLPRRVPQIPLAACPELSGLVLAIAVYMSIRYGSVTATAAALGALAIPRVASATQNLGRAFKERLTLVLVRARSGAGTTQC